jgi:hypothetical protein
MYSARTAPASHGGCHHLRIPSISRLVAGASTLAAQAVSRWSVTTMSPVTSPRRRLAPSSHAGPNG